jgi:hypothetical protein
LPEVGNRIQPPKRCVLKHKQKDILDKDKTMDNVQERNICTKLRPCFVINKYDPSSVALSSVAKTALS